jgi:hypothetical protein
VRGTLGHVIMAGTGATGMQNERRLTTLCITCVGSERAASNSRHKMSAE